MPTSVRRWYMWLPLLVVAGSTLLLIVLWLGVMTAARGAGQPPDALVTAAVVATVCVLLLHVSMVVWTAWVVPVLAAGDARVSFTPNPRRYRATLRATVFTPALLAAILGSVVAAVIVGTAYYDTRTWKLAAAGRAGAPFAVAALVLGGIGAAIDRPLRRRFRRQMGLRPDCFACGYNLTGVTSATCPECGARTTLGRE